MVRRLFLAVLTALFYVSLVAAPVAANNDEDIPELAYSSSVHLPKKDVLYLLTYVGSASRCYATRTYHDGDSDGSDGTNVVIVCNDELSVSASVQLTPLGSYEKDIVFTVIIPPGDVCRVIRTEQSGGDADVDLTCVFATQN